MKSGEKKELLASVSRSFYLSMVFLPRLMREGVVCAYLLARATDTVADVSELPLDTRLHGLEEMQRLINAGAYDAADPFLDELRQGFVPGISHAGERELLKQFGNCLRLLHQLSQEQKTLVRTVLDTIIKGQSWDLQYFAGQSRVTTAEELDLYTYRVAGCVGEFWTDMGFLCYGERFALLDLDEMRTRGRLYGQGLQLVNILRDRHEDAANGRTYITGEVGEWFGKARHNLEQGIAYCEALRGVKLRFTSSLPALLGVKTLDLVETSSESKPKVSRQVVRQTMWQSLKLAFRRPKAG